MSHKKVFISYAWGGKSEEIVDQLDQVLQKEGFTIVRDKRDLGFKGRIKEFMKHIGRGQCVIVVISEKYLKSKSCMFELLQIAKNGQFYDRIFPIVLDDAKINNSIDRIGYVRYWEERIQELDEAMKSVSAANLQGFREDIDLYTEIRTTISELTNILKDMNTLTPEIHHKSEFNELIRSIECKMAEFGDANEDASRPETPSKADELLPPQSFADPSVIRKLDTPGGAVRLDSRFYVKRDHVDERLYHEITKDKGTTTTIRGPRQVGKTSLLIRANDWASQAGLRLVYLDFQEIDSGQLEDLDTFLYHLTAIIVDELCLNLTEVERAWQNPFGSPRRITNLLEKYLLPTVETPFVLMMDEADRLLETSFHDDFFGLVRAWHNRRARNKLWDKLHIVMVISTEPHLLITNAAQSPFNVGLRLELTDFDKTQVCYLDKQYQAGVYPQYLDQFMALFGGHPYLTQQALYTLVVDGLTWAELDEMAPTDTGPFADHLSHYLDLLHKQSALADAMRCIIRDKSCPDSHLLRHLLRAGLVRKQHESYTCRCELYRRYLEGRL